MKREVRTLQGSFLIDFGPFLDASTAKSLLMKSHVPSCSKNVQNVVNFSKVNDEKVVWDFL